MINLLRGKPVELLSFDEIRERLRLREESYRGLQDIPLDKIVGSVGRYREFTRDFLPKNEKMKERWSRVYAQATSMEGLPPIEVYKVGDLYFVRDGNHRVSVARQLGAKFIEAHVTELPTSIELHPDMSQDELEDAAAYAAFLEETKLDQVRPHHKPLKLSERSRYADLLGHIYLHKSILEFMAGRELSIEEAAIHWYDNVYRPALTLIQKYNMMQHLDPSRTETDLYLWLVDHLREVREHFGEQAPSKKISDALVDFLKERGMPVPDELRREDDDSMILSHTQIIKALEDSQDQEKSQPDDTEDHDDIER
ncbi:MAG: hypothetical protein CUN56_12830 [Phototrophicales bacterium]|nr:MAG: hypothetical protein CUN56_12830 [Phototrophicales bacterium]